MTAKTKILVIEDEMPVALLIVALLTRVGCEVEVATIAEEGIQLAGDGDFDLITLDIDLPSASGFEICRRLKEDARSCHTPVVFVSGRPCEDDIKRGLSLGAVDYIVKPFEVTDFIFRIVSHAKVKNRPAPALLPEGATR